MSLSDTNARVNLFAPSGVGSVRQPVDLVLGMPFAQTFPTAPAGTTSTTGVMMGLGGQFTPSRSGNVLFLISGFLRNTGTTAGWGSAGVISYGTGAAPTNGAAPAGTFITNFQTVVNERAASDPGPLILLAIQPGLGIGIQYWFDLDLKAITGGTATVGALVMIALEL